MTLPGRATSDGTDRYRKRHRACAQGHFRRGQGLSTSSVGIGTYLGNPDDATDVLVEEAIRESLSRGVNLVDTAVNYRSERAERSAGRALARMVEAGEVRRDEIIICTKGGYLPAAHNPADWFHTAYVTSRTLGITMEDLAAGSHCMHPAYLLDQIDRSRENLGLEVIDVYYLHNPETQLHEVKGNVFHHRLHLAFEALEQACAQGTIGCYGLATWNAFRVPPGQPEHLDLVEIKKIAAEAAQEHEDHLRYIQLPVNLVMPEALLANQHLEGECVPILEVARQLGISVVASAPLCQGKILGSIPPAFGKKLGKKLTAAQRALQFTRSTPGLLSALVGMKQPDHVQQNLALTGLSPLDTSAFIQLLGGGA